MIPPIEQLRKMVWHARWIWGPGPGEDVFRPGPRGNVQEVRYFRRTFDLDATDGAELIVHLSADSRYRFYVNGQFVGRGPARGDLDHYSFETYDVSPHLRRGRNVLAVQVVSYGVDGPVGEMHDPHGGLVLQGSLVRPGAEPVALDTDAGWRCLVDRAYEPRFAADQVFSDAVLYIDPFEEFRGAAFPWGWERADYDDTAWEPPRLMEPAFGRNQLGHPRIRWRLVPREIAHLTEEPVRPESVLDGPRRDDLARLLQGDEPMTVAAGEELDLTIYMGPLFTGYLALETSGGAGARIELRYAEALTVDGKKSRRDDFSHGSVEPENPSDVVLPGGGDGELWESFWYRTARYLRLVVRAGDAPLVLKALRFRFSSYPFRQRGQFQSDDPDLTTIWDISWHTALCCAHEHYEDCPFYEQLQYISDTRLQALISYFVAGDDTLAREAIRAFARSQVPEGITQSRYPSTLEQIIPTFSLLYVLMVEDHWRHYGDRAFLAEIAPVIGPIMHWFERHMTDDGLVGFIPWWVFVDWCRPMWHDGMPPETQTGACTPVNLMYIASLESAARIYRTVGDPHHADIWQRRAEDLRAAVRSATWSEAEGLFVDGPGSTNLSQHSQVWAILSDTATAEQTERIMQRLLDDPTLTRSTYIHDFYVWQALMKAGAVDRLEVVLGRWRNMVDYGFSTFPESPEPSRSDCHAWSAWPMVEFQRTLLGIRPRDAGWASVTIAPQPLGRVTRACGSVPTCRGQVAAAWRRDGERLTLKARVPAGVPAHVVLPDGTTHVAEDGGEIVLGDAAMAGEVELPGEC